MATAPAAQAAGQSAAKLWATERALVAGAAPGEQAREMHRDLERALAAGALVLESGGSALDAVVAAVVVLEDSVHFNAGRGSVLRADGSARMDASLMCGSTRAAGAVAGVQFAQNPIRVAQCVLSDGRHVLRAGEHADRFAREQKLALQAAEYFVTPYRREQWERAHARGAVQLDHTGDDRGTVGAVARDSAGHLAAATSTGGLTNADPGRVGDSPIIGAGTWAHDGSCAVSATGTGEFFMRTAFAHSVHAHWLRSQDLAASTALALTEVRQLGGSGGCIAVDREGRIATPFTTPDMPRAYRTSGGAASVIVFDPEPAA